MKYVDIVIANNSDNTDRFYTYACMDDAIQIGQKVYVSFAKGSRLKEGYVFRIMDELQEEIKGLKQIDSIDEQICLTEEIVNTCRWMRDRYACRYIECVNCFTPVGSASKRGKKRNPYAGAIGEEQKIASLTVEQKEALAQVLPVIREKRHALFLLHGVTGSGKTEVYMQAIEGCIQSGRTAIMLVPEISLTPQIIERFIGRFGAEQIAVLHSRLSLGERYDEWVRIRSGQVKIVIGARSAVFAPLKKIGIVILDEEHEATFKSDKSPKYDTVEIAIKRVKTQQERGVVLLGSATPSVVSYFRASEGIYAKIALRKRYNQVELPTVKTVDMRKELLEGNRSVLSRALFDEMQSCLSQGRQAILFLNRRGYSTFISCRECGYVMECADCKISLTYHKAEEAAICHYCGHRETVPHECPSCGSRYIRHFGSGTEKVEEETAALFPAHRVARLDLDTIKKKGEIDKILNDFKRGTTRILVGTQLVAKGLDFAHVGLVGIISADTMLNIPDYRSAERTFQLITQAAGRAGRGDTAGKVIIQTYTPDHYSVLTAAKHDYEGFYRTEIELRNMLRYPPYVDLILAVFLAENADDAHAASNAAYQEWKEALGTKESENIFPPQELTFFKQNGVRYQILIKAPHGKKSAYVELLAEMKRRLAVDKKNKVSMSIDINPYSFL